VAIGSDVLASDNVFIADSYHAYRAPDQPALTQSMTPARPVSIGDGAFLGIACLILPGVTIGERAYIGAGSVVTTDIPALAVAAGNPARVIRHWDPVAAAWRDGAPEG
jgi:acetyltransferase-like isoleucine patch superfamily enzyme